MQQPNPATRDWGAVVTGIAIALVLLIPALIAISLGASDVGSALTFGGRLEGAFVLAVGLFLFFGAAAVLFHGQPRHKLFGTLALGAALAAAVLALITLVVEIVQPVRRLEVMLGAGVIFGAALWATVQLRARGAKLPRPRSIALAAVISALFAAVNLFYTDIYEPAAQPRRVDLTATIGIASVAPGHPVASLPVTIDFKNLSKHKLVVLMTSYSVVGYDFPSPGTGSVDDALHVAAGTGEGTAGSNEASRFALLQSGQFLPFSTVEQEASKSVTELVPIALPVSYDAITVDAEVFLLRADQATVLPSFAERRRTSWTEASLSRPDWIFPCAVGQGQTRVAQRYDFDFVRLQAPVVEGSRIKRFTMPSRKVTAWWVLAPPGPAHATGPYLEATIARPGGEMKTPSPAYYEQLSREYGFQLTVSGTQERSVWDVGLGSPQPPLAPSQPSPPRIVAAKTNDCAQLAKGVAAALPQQPPLYAAAPGAEVPFTGAAITAEVLLGLACLGLGVTFVVLSRRPKPGD